MIRRTLLSWFLDCQCAAAVTAWVLSTCVAHANPEAPYPKAVKTLSCSGTQCREKSSGIARECETKMSAEGKLENERELKIALKIGCPPSPTQQKGIGFGIGHRLLSSINPTKACSHFTVCPLPISKRSVPIDLPAPWSFPRTTMGNFGRFRSQATALHA